MAICKPRYPENISNITNVPDFSRLFSGNPVDKYDADELSTLNVLFNALLQNSNLDAYPDLQDRVSIGELSIEEFADFISDTGINLEYIKEELINDFPVEIDYEAVKNLVVDTRNAINEQVQSSADFNFYGTTVGEQGLDANSAVSTLDDQTLITFTANLNGNENSVNSNGDTLIIVFNDKTLEFGVIGENDYSFSGGTSADGIISIIDGSGTITIIDNNGNVIINSEVVLKSGDITIDDGSGTIVIKTKENSTIVSSDIDIDVAPTDVSDAPQTSPNTSVANTSDPDDIFLNNGNFFGANTFNFASSSPIDPIDVTNIVPTNASGGEWVPGTGITDIFNMADNFYATSFGNNGDSPASNFNRAACSGFSNPFARLIALVAAVSSIRDLAAQTISEISEFISDPLGAIGGLIGSLAGDIQNLINDIQEYGNLAGIIQSLSRTLASFQQQLLDLPQQIAESMLSQISGIASSFQNFAEQVNNLSNGSFRHIQRMIQQTRDFFSGNIIENIRDAINSFFDLNTQQFEDLLPDVLNFLLLQSCGLANLIENLMRAPVDRLRSMVSGFTDSHGILSSFSDSRRNSIITAGGLRIPADQARTESGNGISNWNSSLPPIDDDYIAPPFNPHELAGMMASISREGVSGLFTFSSSVQNMARNATSLYNRTESAGNNPTRYGVTHREAWSAAGNVYNEDTEEDMGWTYIRDRRPYVWAMLIRAVTRCHDSGAFSGPLTINSAYRSRYYNYFNISGGAQYSNHMEGRALDISFGSMGGDRGEAAFIDAVSQEGFVRIVRYAGSGFYHIDIGPGSRSGHWTGSPSSQMGPLAVEAWNRHVNRG